MAIDRTWPITADMLRKALGFPAGQGDDDELDLFATAACEAIDIRTGRDVDPTRYLVTVSGQQVVPITLINAARETAKLWYQQSKNGPKGVRDDQAVQGPPMGAGFPRKVDAWLDLFPAPPGFGRDDEAGTPPPENDDPDYFPW